MSLQYQLIALATLLFLCVLASKVTNKYGVPSLLIFLIVGMIAGSEGPGGIYFDNVSYAQSVGIISLLMILFSGGLDTEWKGIKPHIGKGLILATLGVALTTALVAVFCHYVLSFDWKLSLLTGAVVSSTDAAATFNVLRSQKIQFKNGLRETLEFESGSNDPMAIFLTLLFIRWIQTDELSLWMSILQLAWQMLVGLLVGYAFGRWFRLLINRISLEIEGLYPVITVSCVLVTYALPELIQGNGFLAVYVCALTLGRETFVHKKSLILIHDSLAWIMQIIMFLTLGILVYPSKVMDVAAEGIVLTLFLLFIARPVTVYLSLVFTKLNWREKAMTSWLGLRGAVPIILATFVITAEVPGSDRLFNIIFFVVILSTLFQGPTIGLFSRWLKVGAPEQKRFRFPLDYVPGGELKSELHQIEVPAHSRALGQTIAELNIPDDILIVLLKRKGSVFAPRGKTEFQEADVLLTLCAHTGLVKLRDLIAPKEYEDEAHAQSEKAR